MADDILKNIPLPADLPENWTFGLTIAPTGAEVGMDEQHGYNYLMKQVNNAQKAATALNEGKLGLHDAADNGVVASGESYVRFGDGTQICWMSTGVGVIAANTIYTGTFTYPLPFTSTPVFLVSLRGNPANNDYKSIICGSNGPAGKESHEYYICNNASTSASPGISIVVIGRWK